MVVDTLGKGWAAEAIFEMDLTQFLALRDSLVRLEKERLKTQFSLVRVALNGDAEAATKFLGALA